MSFESDHGWLWSGSPGVPLALPGFLRRRNKMVKSFVDFF